MKKKYLIGIPVFAILAALTVGSTTLAAGGFGRFNSEDSASFAKNWGEKISQHAGILGISIEEMKSFWSKGKNLPDIAEEKGLNVEELRLKMQNLHQEQMKQRMQSLVDSGQITSEQVEAKLKFMEENKGKMKGDCLNNDRSGQKVQGRFNGGMFRK